MTGQVFCTGAPFAPWQPAQACALSSTDCADAPTGSSAASRMDEAASRAEPERVDIETSIVPGLVPDMHICRRYPEVETRMAGASPGHVADCPKLRKTSSRYSNVKAMMALPR